MGQRWVGEGVRGGWVRGPEVSAVFSQVCRELA